MRFLVFGAGALGQALGCMLAVAGHHIDLVLRRRFIDAIKKDGLRVRGIFGDYLATPAMLGLLEDGSGAEGPYDFVLITTKAYDTSRAIAAIASLPYCCCPVVSMQNGCGNVEQVLERFGLERSLGARVITGFEIVVPGQIRITVSADAIHLGAAVAGPIPAAAEILAGAIDRAGLPCRAVADIHQDLFAKLLYNCALNPLGAILGVHYGALAENKATKAIMDKVIAETFAVIQGIGGKTPWPDADSYKDLFYNRLLPITSEHRPSMLQDLEHNKPTEVDALLGYVSAQGRTAAVPTPTCDLLADLVRFKESRARSGSLSES
jgi:2-dehydropantoate 2-reductase